MQMRLIPEFEEVIAALCTSLVALRCHQGANCLLLVLRPDFLFSEAALGAAGGPFDEEGLRLHRPILIDMLAQLLGYQ